MIEIRIPFRDIDMHGRMFATAYISHAETAIAQFWRLRPQIENEPAYLTRKAACTIFTDIGYDALARFTVVVDKIGMKTVGFSVAVEAGNEHVADVDILWHARWVEKEEPATLPEETRDWLYGFLA